MSFTTLVRKYPVRTAVICFALGAVTTLPGVAVVATFWTAERFVEQRTEPTADAPRIDLVVMQKGKPQGLDGEFREYFASPRTSRNSTFSRNDRDQHPELTCDTCTSRRSS